MSMTSESAEQWSDLSAEWQIKRLTDWAQMLETRLAELDPLYRAYPFGRAAASLAPKEDAHD